MNLNVLILTLALSALTNAAETPKAYTNQASINDKEDFLKSNMRENTHTLPVFSLQKNAVIEFSKNKPIVNLGEVYTGYVFLSCDLQLAPNLTNRWETDPSVVYQIKKPDVQFTAESKSVSEAKVKWDEKWEHFKGELTITFKLVNEKNAHKMDMVCTVKKSRKYSIGLVKSLSAIKYDWLDRLLSKGEALEIKSYKSSQALEEISRPAVELGADAAS